jgi:hypothetical protein
MNRRDLDDVVFPAVRDAMEEAAKLYNSGNPTASYYRFWGAIKSVEPLLAHRPQLQTTVRQGVGSAERFAESEMIGGLGPFTTSPGKFTWAPSRRA